MDPRQEGAALAPWAREVEFVFLVGCPRSGTTWLQALLASHPEVMTGPETHFFASFAPVEKAFLHEKDRRVGLQEYWSADDFHAETARLFRVLISRLPAPATRPRYFLEKTPQHGEHAGFIERTLPGARFVHIVRDARAVVASLLQAAGGWGRSWAPGGVDDATHLWLYHVRECRLIRERAADRYFEVRYEDLRADAAGSLKRIFDWLGLPSDAALLRAAVEANSLDKARGQAPFGSIPQAGAPSSRPAYPDGFVGAAPVDPEALPLAPLQRRRVEHFAAPLLRELGYADAGRSLSLRERLLTSRPIRRLLGLPVL